jgi:hypothetical protein
MLRSHPFLVSRITQCAVMLTLAAAVPAAAEVHLPVPPESFLNYHAANVNQLSQEVTVDPQVRARLAKHFHVTPAQMVTYIHKNLVLRHLQKSGVYRVACVRRDGSEYWIESRLPAGTPVFASRATGQPILKLACGNPMVSALPQIMATTSHLAPPRLASTPVTMADSDLNTPPVLTALDGTQSDLLTTDNLSAPPLVRVSPSIELLGGSSGFNIFPALLGAGAAIAVAGHGGSASPNGVPSPPAAVPETSTVISFGLLLMGGAFVLIMRRKTSPENA